jgi:hypothetical protein
VGREEIVTALPFQRPTLRRFLSLLFVTLVPAFAQAAEAFDVRPAPAWVDRVAVDPRATRPSAEVRSGIYMLLSDHQVRLHDGTTTEYYRRVRKVMTPSGVQNASELSLDFDPSFQRLTIHSVTILRDGRAIDALDANDVRVIDKESESDDRIYDGQLTALLFLKDVRPGDVIDAAWSLTGANPLLGGRYADEYEISSGMTSRVIRHRLVAPASRPLHYRSTLKGFAPRVALRGDEQELIWERHDAPAVDAEEQTPEWFDPWETVQVSEFANWNDVAKWANELFHADGTSAAAIRDLAADIRAHHKTQHDQLVAAIRFVQDDIRYLGIEMGRNSHEPHPPSITLSQRYGDCKDKSFLLALLLRELGVDAYPALVNTKLRHRLDDYLPSPFLFDHVIVEVVEHNRVHWVDATLSEQGGDLATIDTPNDERALIVRPDVTSLAKIATRDGGSTLIEETYTSTDATAPAALVVKRTYRGGDADNMRAHLADLSLADLAKDDLNRYAADHPKLAARGLPQIVDQRDANVITINEAYEVRDLWTRGTWSYVPHAITRHLERPATIIRTMPLAFDYPLNVTERAVFHLPGRVDLASSHDSRSSAAFRVDTDVQVDGRTVTIEHRLRSLSDAVAAGAVADHLTKVNDVMHASAYELEPSLRPSLADAFDFSVRSDRGYLAIAAIFLVVNVVALTRRRRRRA